ncbi:acyltransferase family protein [Ruania rhizosphaerae]|uniref:acyltransferase family protein n=1 Tax=Ruania rhizosphaerae TaxID=1840413 RepID=UPI00135B1B67|nr:acyltransferase [Ruania rhizosphaerae]
MSPIATAASPPRLTWVDVAKAVAIILVVHYHVSVAGAGQLLPGSSSSLVSWWSDVSRALIPVRMPLFFLASGLLASNAIERPWRRLWRPRVGNLLWPFLLWSVLFAVLCAPRYDPEDPGRYMRSNLEAIGFGGTAYWFLSVLVVFFLTARLLRRFRYVLLLVGVALVAIAPLVSSFLVNALDTPQALASNISRVCYFAVWYFVGCFGRPAVERIATGATWLTAAAAGGIYVGFAWAIDVGGIADSITPLLILAMNVLGLVTACQLAFLTAKSGAVQRVSRYLAGRTLAIYVLHPVLLSGLILLLRRDDGTTVLPLASPAVDALLFPVVTAMLVVASTALYDLSQKLGARWLFALPGDRAPDRT